MDNRVVNAFIAETRLLKSNEDVFRLAGPLVVNGKTFGPGALYVRSKPTTAGALQRTLPLGVSYEGTTAAPPADGVKLRTPRVGMWDVYGGNQEAGWMRWVLDTYEFAFDRVFAQALDAGNLDQKYDILIFPQGGIPGAAGGGRGGGGAPDAIPNLPAESQSQVGRVSVEQTLPKIRDFIEKGGTVLAIGTSATNLAEYLELPVENQLVEGGAPLPPTKLFIPGSVLSAKVDPSSVATAGMSEHTNVFFDNSPVFKLSRIRHSSFYSTASTRRCWRRSRSGYTSVLAAPRYSERAHARLAGTGMARHRVRNAGVLSLERSRDQRTQCDYSPDPAVCHAAHASIGIDGILN
jgi:hypothetical protein